MKKAYTLFAILLLAAMVLANCAAPQPAATQPPTPAVTEMPAATQPPAEMKKIVIGWTPPDITGVFKTATDFFEKSTADARANGIDAELITQAVTSHTQFADQVAIIEDYIQRNVDVIAVSPIELEVIKPALKKANEAGIPVIMVNLLEPQSDVEIASYIGFDNTVAAEVSAYSLLDYFGGPGVLGTGEKVEVAPDQYLDIEFWRNLYKDLPQEEKDKIQASGAIIEGVAGGFFSAARLKGFHNVVDQYPGIKILGVPCAADWNREKGIKCAEDFLQANPEGMDFIWAASNEMGLGAMIASENAGRLQLATDAPQPGGTKVAVFTNDVTPESVDRISEGKIVAETTHGFADWGWYGGEYAVMLACGEDVPETFDIRPRTVYQTNARQFYPDPALPPIDWAKIKEACKQE